MLMNHSPKAIEERIEQERAVLRKVQPLVRSPLKRGNRYQFHGYPVGIEITHVAFRGHEEDDGGLQGVGIKWWGYPNKREGGFYPCASDSEFFDMLIFRNAYDEPNDGGEGREPCERTYPPPCSASPVAQPSRDVSELYHELLYAVARKFPGESRHETALRYIRDTEELACQPVSCKQNAHVQPER